MGIGPALVIAADVEGVLDVSVGHEPVAPNFATWESTGLQLLDQPPL
jgi:hypothetical protein